MSFRETPLRTAVEELFGVTDLSFTMNGSVPNVPITMNVKDAPFDTALGLLARAAQAQIPRIKVKKLGNAYHFDLGPAVSKPTR